MDEATLRLTWKTAGQVICEGCPALLVRPVQNMVYTLEYSINGQCGGKAETLVRVANNLRFSVPTIFNPGSSGGNNRFFIPRQLGIERVQYIYVFSSWAENVFSVFDVLPGIPETGWDGTFKGRELNPGVYVVIARLKLSSGEEWLYQGDLLLLR
jgi:hypothetical protein